MKVALVGSGLLFLTGCWIGIVAGERALNWCGAQGNWDIGVTDQYELVMGRAAAVDTHGRIHEKIYWTQGSAFASAVDADVRLAPYLFSSLDGTDGLGDANVRDSLGSRQPVHTNGLGEVSISGHWAAEGPSLSPSDFVPPLMGATFMVGDGRNAAGGFTYYELLIERGRVWSIGSLTRFDCAASALYRSCQRSDMENAVTVYAVQTMISHLGEPTGEHTLPNRGPTGTLVQAAIMMPSL